MINDSFSVCSHLLQIYLKKNANFQIKCGNYPKAAEMFEIIYEHYSNQR